MDISEKVITENTWILYRTENLVNGKIYVGVHKVTDTWNSRNYLGSGKTLKKAIEKYSREKFTRTTLAKFDCAEDAYFLESLIVDENFINRKDTYNMKVGGMGGIGAFLGRTHSKETKLKMSIIAAKRERSPATAETRAKMSAASKGKPKNEAHKAKLAAANKGKITPKEVQAKIAAANSKPVSINGRYYCSIKIASEIEKIDKGTLGSRVRNSKPKWSEWRFATKISNIRNPCNDAL